MTADQTTEGPEVAHVTGGTTPFSQVVATPTNGTGSVRIVNNVAHLLALSPAVVTVVVVVACTILGIDRVLHTNDVVTVLLAAIGAHQAVVAAQSLRRTA